MVVVCVCMCACMHVCACVMERARLPPPLPCQRDGSDDYMALISKRVEDNSFAQKEREKRRRKVLMDQMRALRSQEVGGWWLVWTGG